MSYLDEYRAAYADDADNQREAYETLLQKYNTAVANGLVIKARRIERQIRAIEDK